jgi:hypothetical protein
MLGSAQAAGRGVDFRYHEVVPVDTIYVVNASVALQPPARLEEMVDSGVSVPFLLEFTITRGRWYWFDETVVNRSMNFRLAYHALTRQYRLTIGSIHRNFPSYEEALRAMLTLRNWNIAERSSLLDGEAYTASIRFRLDMAQLPKPFQIAAIGNKDMDLNSGWEHWGFVGSAADPR